jgi:CBS domain containing-hemolysin-like protein
MLSAFFSGVETALMAINAIKVKTLFRQKKRGSAALYRIKQNPQRLIITILIGNNLVNIAAASLATVIFTDIFGSSGVGIATGIMTFLILIFGEITPKTFATQNSVRISLLVARPIELLSMMIYPVVRFFEFISRFMSKVLGSREEKHLSEEELKTIVTMGAKEGLLDKESAEMMHNVLEFRGTKVTEVMTPKVSVEMVDGRKRLKEVINFVVKTPFSRYPIYEKSEDNIIGILDVDDVLKYAKNNRLDVRVKNLAREIFFVPEAKEIDDLMVEFEEKDMRMAIVVDEYGEVSGLATMEDILEEIVGDIFDKSKRKSVFIKKINDKLIRVDGRAPINDLNKILNLELEEGDDFDTIAGFIVDKLEKIPEKGEKIKFDKFTIEVDKVTRQGIKSVRIIWN